MKKFKVSLMIAALLFTFSPMKLNATVNSITTETPLTDVANKALLLSLNFRLNEINEMDKSNLSGPEKRELRKEVRAIKSDITDHGGVIYISAGALIIIILLLIILL